MAVLEVKHIGKHFDSTRVLDDVSFDLEEGSALASGALRSTSNFCIARFVFLSLSPDHGESRQQLAAAPGDGRLPLREALRRLRGQDRGPLSALCHGQLLA